MTTYLLKCSACVAIVYAVYYLLFRNSNNFQWNRAYLLSGLLLSFALPAIVVPATAINVQPITMAGSAVMEDIGTQTLVHKLANYDRVLFFIYYTGLAISALVLIASMLKSFTIYLSGRKIVRNGRAIIIHPSIQPHSFFGILFIRSEDEDPIVIEHEMVHIRQRHWVDLAILEIASILLWFNPFIHLYRRSLTIQHEYIADREVVKTTSVETYLACISTYLESTVTSKLISGFATQSIKQRIVMITSTRDFSKATYIIVLPLFAILFTAFTTTRSPEVTITQDNSFRPPVDIDKLTPGEGAGFGKRFNPSTNSEVFHTGIDFVLASGSDVYAVSDGVVISAATSGDYGNLVVIAHGSNLGTASAHLERILVKVGEKVKAGQKIGTVGSTGASAGPHLHFEVLENGKAVDPAGYLKTIR